MLVHKQGITAVEVMASTLLAALLMVAMLGVMRGLKAQATALESRLPIPGWHQTLGTVLQADFENSRTYEVTSEAIVLRGHAGRDAVTGIPTWRPTTIVYERVSEGKRSWLVRRELADNRWELVLTGVTSFRLSTFIETDAENENAEQAETPIVDGLILEFWGNDLGGPLYGFRYQRP